MNNAALPLLLTSLWLGTGSASGQTALSPPLAGDWIISETSSPIDYSPIVIATTQAKQSTESSPMELSIYCRGGRTYIVVSGRTISRSESYELSYSVNRGSSTQAGVGASLFGGIAVPGETVGLLLSLPGEGMISIRLTTRSGSTREGAFALNGLKAVRDKLGIACNWPPTNSKPRS